MMRQQNRTGMEAMTSTPDLVIRGGTVADGKGGELFEADVAISGGRITEVGKVAGKGKEEIDAKGKLVTPGFVDVHTHYDGQVTWSNDVTPSSQNGVTTVIMGNCGVGFAPCRPADHTRLIELMEGVEDIKAMAAIAADAIRAGALGFSTSRTINHRTSTGDFTPTLKAGEDELTVIASAMRAAGPSYLQFVLDNDSVMEDLPMMLRVAENT